jgi:hypothetical protein
MSVKWIETEQIPEPIRAILAAFEDAFTVSNTGYTVTHLRSDAVFVGRAGWCNPYQVAKFIKNNPGIYCEIVPTSRNYYEFRMFSSQWISEHELPRMRAIASSPARDIAAPLSVRMRVKCYKEWLGELKAGGPDDIPA